MSIFAWIILGLIAGFIGSKVVNNRGEGLVLDLVLGIVGVVASLALSLFVRDPRWRRGERKHVTAASRPSRRTLAKVVRGFLTRPDLLMTALAAAVPTMVNYGMLTFAALLLMRGKGMTLRELAQYFGPVLGVTMGFGMYASGWYADRYGPRNLQAYAWIPAIALAIAAPFFVAFTAASNWRKRGVSG